MVRHGRTAAAALVVACMGATAAQAVDPRLQDVLSAVTLSFGDDGALDRAVLTQSEDDATLTIYRGVPGPGEGRRPVEAGLRQGRRGPGRGRCGGRCRRYP